MRLFSGSLALLLVVMLGIGCNTVSADECWVNTSGGFGGSGTIPIGAGVGATSSGDFADPPRRPLDSSEAPNPCIMAESPCHEKCLAAYESAAIACGKIENAAERKTCQEAAYAPYKGCHESCQRSEINDCRKECENKAEACEARCRKLPEDDKAGRQKCWIECNNAYAACIKKCKD